MCVPWIDAGGTRSRLVKEIGLITQAERRSVIRTIRYSIARFRFLIRRRVLVSYSCVLASRLCRSVLLPSPHPQAG
jgi:hypothetical protein